jgi:CheY-like chemotaxis protein
LLLVEDEPLILLAAQDALESGGYVVLAAHSGSEAVRMLDEQAELLAGLITDVRLGSAPDGWEVARHARSLKPDIPVVYTTGDSAADWPVHGIPQSVVVQKPYAPAQLVTAISALLTKIDTTNAH